MSMNNRFAGYTPKQLADFDQLGLSDPVVGRPGRLEGAREGLMLPFTVEQFFAVFAAYNAAIWPAPLVAYALGLAAVAVPILAQRFAVPAVAHRFVAVALALMWLWTGLLYHALFFSAVNPAAYAFALLFVVEALALLIASRKLQFIPATALDFGLGLFFILYALALYPLIGAWAGHSYPAAPVFGTAPCPVAIFTFGVLMLTQGRPSWWVLAPAFVWSLIGGSAAILLGVVQDWVLPFSGLVAIARLSAR
jgi:hypothetical protein